MFFRRKRRNKRDTEVDVVNNQNISPNDVRDRRGSRRGSIVGRIWKSMRIKRRNQLPDVREPEVFRQPRPRASDPIPPPVPNNREIISRRDDSTLDNILSSRMKSYNVSPAVTNLVTGPTRGSPPSANEFNSPHTRGNEISINEHLESNQLRVPSSNPERRRSASADRNRRHDENSRLYRLRESSNNNIERPRSHDYEGHRQNNRLLEPIYNNQERPVSDSRLLERYFRQHESRSRAALQPSDRSSRSRSAEISSVVCRHPPPLVETTEREAERNNRDHRIIYQSREQRLNHHRHNNPQRENVQRSIHNEYEIINEPNERIHEFIRELRITNGGTREQQSHPEVIQENRSNFQRSANETRDLRMVNRDFRIPVENTRDYRIIAQANREYNPNESSNVNNINLHRSADLPREYRPVAEISHDTRELYDALYRFNQQDDVFTGGNLRSDPPPYDEAINRQYTATLTSRPPSYSHVVEEILNERLMMSNTNVNSRMNQPTRLRRNPPLAIRS